MVELRVPHFIHNKLYYWEKAIDCGKQWKGKANNATWCV